MAISSDQPISAANLKAVVDKLMGGGYLPETLVATCATGTDVKSVAFEADLSRYSKLDVTVSVYSGHGVFQGQIEPALGKYTLNKISSDPYTHSLVKITLEKHFSSNVIHLSQDSQWDISAVRIVGYPKLT